jgi:hypothetical protein
VLSATIIPVYFHQLSFCTATAEYMKVIGENEKDFSDAINVEV